MAADKEMAAMGWRGLDVEAAVEVARFGDVMMMAAMVEAGGRRQVERVALCLP